MHALRLPAFIIALMCLASCGQHVITGQGASKTESRALQSAAFNKIEISAPVDARITVGGPAALSFEGYANIIPHLRTEVKNNTLRIYLDEITDISTDKNLIAHISLPALAALDLSGSSDATIAGVLNAQSFSLDMSGASDVTINELHVKDFEADMSGSTSLSLMAGDIGNGNFDVAGSGEIKAMGVIQQSAELDIAGSGETEVNVSAKLNVDISGSGAVKYKGHPAISQEISGSGSITDAN